MAIAEVGFACLSDGLGPRALLHWVKSLGARHFDRTLARWIYRAGLCAARLCLDARLDLIDPVYSLSQLPAFIAAHVSPPAASERFIVGRTPNWMFRFIVDMSGIAMGHTSVLIHSCLFVLRRL